MFGLLGICSTDHSHWYSHIGPESTELLVPQAATKLPQRNIIDSYSIFTPPDRMVAWPPLHSVQGSSHRAADNFAPVPKVMIVLESTDQTTYDLFRTWRPGLTLG